MKSKTFNVSLGLLRLIAIFLIINSHFDRLYPKAISFLASGGSIGNGLFFALSGYFYYSEGGKMKSLLKRFFRLFIPTWIILVISIISGETTLGGRVDIIKYLIWPTRFWFVGVIFLFYVIMTFLPVDNWIRDRKLFIIFTCLLFALDIVVWLLLIPDKSIWIVEDARILKIFPYKTIYCFFEFCMGRYIRNNRKTSNYKVLLLLSTVMFIAFFGFKFMLNRDIVPMEFQILSQPLTILCSFLFLATFLAWDMSKINSRWKRYIALFSSLSLEVYLVQFLIINSVEYLSIVFPLNFAMCISLIFVAAYLLYKGDSVLYDKVCEKFQLIGSRNLESAGQDPSVG